MAMDEHAELDLDDPYLAGWPERWRHPHLLAELERLGADAVGIGRWSAAQAWLRDLAHPPGGLAEVLRTMTECGHLAAADRLVADTALLEREGVDAAVAGDALSAAAAARRHDERRANFELAARARAAGVAVSHEPGAEPIEEQVSAGERQRRAGIDGLLDARGDDDPVTDLINSLLDAGEYAVAEKLLAAAPEEVESGLTAVPRVRPWPYDEPTGEILGWFDDNADRPRDFDWRRPPPEDAAGLALVRALRDAWATLDLATARRLAEAVDGMLVDHPVSHHPVSLPGGGFAVRVFGLSDRHLPWLGLRHRVLLTIGPHRPAPAEEVGVWLPLADGEMVEPADHVALLTPRDLLQVVAPLAGRRAGTTHQRRINVLRILCSTLDARSVVDRDPGDLGTGPETREAIAGMLDMLSLRLLEPGLPDVILYDTSGLPAAVCAVVRELGTRSGRPGDLTVANLAALRADQEAVDRILQAVTAPLGGDPNALVVLGALILRHAETDGATVDANIVAGELAALGGAAAPPVSVEHVDVADGLRRLNAAGLVSMLEPSAAEGLRVGFIGDGLAALLQEGLAAATVDRLRELDRLTRQRARAVRIAVERRTAYSCRHLHDNYVFIQSQLAQQANRPDLGPADRQRLAARLQWVGDRLRTLRLAEQGRAGELAPSRFDLHEALTEFELLHDYEEAPVAIAVRRTARVPRPLPVQGIQELVQFALDDLVVNAHRAMDRAHSPQRRVQVTADIGDRMIERVAILDIEDSGPGFDGLDGPDVERQQAGMAGGNGLFNAAMALDSCRGELMRMADPSNTLGGAHVRVVMPLSE